MGSHVCAIQQERYSHVFVDYFLEYKIFLIVIIYFLFLQRLSKKCFWDVRNFIVTQKYLSIFFFSIFSTSCFQDSENKLKNGIFNATAWQDDSLDWIIFVQLEIHHRHDKMYSPKVISYRETRLIPQSIRKLRIHGDVCVSIYEDFIIVRSYWVGVVSKMSFRSQFLSRKFSLMCRQCAFFRDEEITRRKLHCGSPRCSRDIPTTQDLYGSLYQSLEKRRSLCL